MKDSEFIELLNLYLDHEISAADASRLEAEVQANPARRRVYQDYCRMQKACKILAADFANEMVAASDKKVVAFNSAAVHPSRGVGAGLYVFGGLAAAAACVALVFVNRSAPQGNESVATAAQASQTIAAAASDAARPTAPAPEARQAFVRAHVPPQAQRAQAMLVDNSLSLTAQTQSGATLVNAMHQTNASDQFGWLHTVQVSPMQLGVNNVNAEQLRFDLQPAALRTEGRQLGSARNRAPATAKPPADEMITWEFRK